METDQQTTGELAAVSSTPLLALRRAWGFVARIFSPGYSWCHRCKRPWTVCEGHSTEYQPGRWCFPLCEECWGELSPATRLPYYRQLWNEWKACEPLREPQWQDIERAVLNERANVNSTPEMRPNSENRLKP